MSLEDEKAQSKITEDYAANTRLMVKISFIAIAIISVLLYTMPLNYLIGY